MFERFENAKRERGGWRTVTLAASVVAHLIGGMALVIWSFWHIERLQTKAGVLVDIGAPLPPPPALGAPEAPPDVKTVRKPPKPVKPTDVVQPTKTPEPSKPEEPEGPDTPSTPGVPTGVPGGDLNAPPSNNPPGTGTGTPEPQPPPIADTNVDISVLETMRISGNRQIGLPPSVLQKLHDNRQPETSAAIFLCLDANGVPKSVKFLKSTGFGEADQKIRSEVLEWRYRPLVVGGRAVPACTGVKFRYVIE